MEAHATRVRKTYMAGAGISGAVLACAGIVFISLVGLVSLAVWPSSDSGFDPVNSTLSPSRSGGASPHQPETSALAAPAIAPAPGTAATAETAASGKGDAKPNGRPTGDGQGQSKTAADSKAKTVAPVSAPPVNAVPEPSGPGASGERSRSGDQGGTANGNPHASGRTAIGKSANGHRGKAKGKHSAARSGSGSNGNGHAYGQAKHGG